MKKTDEKTSKVSFTDKLNGNDKYYADLAQTGAKVAIKCIFKRGISELIEGTVCKIFAYDDHFEIVTEFGKKQTLSFTYSQLDDIQRFTKCAGGLRFPFPSNMRGFVFSDYSESLFSLKLKDNSILEFAYEDIATCLPQNAYGLSEIPSFFNFFDNIVKVTLNKVLNFYFRFIS